MKKRIFIRLLLVLIICFSLSPVTYAVGFLDREALSGSDNDGTGIVEVYKVIKRTSKNTIIEPLDITLSMKGWWINKYIVSSGDKIYFLACKKKNKKKSSFRLYECDMKSKKYKLLYKMPAKYIDGYLQETYDGSVYMRLDTKKDSFCLRYNIKSGKLKTIFKSFSYYRYDNYLVFEKLKDRYEDPLTMFVQYNNEYTVYNTRTGKRKTIFDGHAEGLVRIGRYLYYAESTDGRGLEINTKTRYKIVRYDLVTGKKKTILKPEKFLEIEFVTDKYVYHQTWTWGTDTYYRYDLKSKKNKKISEDSYLKAKRVLSKSPDAETDFWALG